MSPQLLPISATTTMGKCLSSVLPEKKENGRLEQCGFVNFFGDGNS